MDTFFSNNIPSTTSYGVFISHLIRYARACSSYCYFYCCEGNPTFRTAKERLESSLKKFNCRYGDLSKQYEVPLSRITGRRRRMLNDILKLGYIQWHPPLIILVNKPWPRYRLQLLPNYKIGAFSTGVVCLQVTLTHPYTLSRPIWDLYLLHLLRRILFLSLSLF